MERPSAEPRRGEVMSCSESALIERCRRGDSAAFEEIVRVYGRQIYSFLARATGSAEEARELLQETFVRALSALPGLDPSRALRPWLFRIASNLSADYFRRFRRRPTVALPETLSHAPPYAESDSRIDMERALGELPPILREALLMFHMHGMTIAEICEVTGLGANTVKSRLRRARECLRELLEGREP
jgi:RNA polymerase sigma-70 factor (ECF subfamily)